MAERPFVGRWLAPLMSASRRRPYVAAAVAATIVAGSGLTWEVAAANRPADVDPHYASGYDWGTQMGPVGFSDPIREADCRSGLTLLNIQGTPEDLDIWYTGCLDGSRANSRGPWTGPVSPPQLDPATAAPAPDPVVVPDVVETPAAVPDVAETLDPAGGEDPWRQRMETELLDEVAAAGTRPGCAEELAAFAMLVQAEYMTTDEAASYLSDDLAPLLDEYLRLLDTIPGSDDLLGAVDQLAALGGAEFPDSVGNNCFSLAGGNLWGSG